MQILKGYLHNEAVWAVLFTPDGRELVSVGSQDQILWWDLATGTSRKGHRQSGYLPMLALSPDGRCLVRGTWGAILVLGRDDGTSPPQSLACSRRPDGLCFSPDGRVLAAAAEDLYRWDAATWQPLSANWLRRNEHCTALAYVPDGRTLAVAAFAPRRRVHLAKGPYAVLLLDAQTGTETGELHGSTGSITSLAVSPDGKSLAGVAGQTLWVWDLATREAVLRERFDTRHFKQAAFTPDSRHLIAVRNDETVRVWATDGWSQRAAFDWDIGPLVSLAVAADGMRAAAGSKKGRILVWDLDL